ncbi:MAG: site-specific integrase [Pseudomonadota bacterium]|nr:site-specific integrase [Pseudomonadota bacterium]
MVSSSGIDYLMEDQVNAMTRSFQDWYDASVTDAKRRSRGKYWLTFLTLRYTGARLREVQLIDDANDIDRRNCEFKIKTLKQKYPKKPVRSIPVPSIVTVEIANYLMDFPGQKGKLFMVDQGNFRRVFYERAKNADIPRDLAHPHILRHTRATELLKGGVPITVVQDILGHSALTTTAVYLRISGQEAKMILKDRGFI